MSNIDNDALNLQSTVNMLCFIMLSFTIYYCENYYSPTSKMDKLKWSC